jgi:tRNA modification GTPase
MVSLDDTIAAIASAAGGGLRGIVRISGPACVAVVSRLGEYGRPLIDVDQPSCISGTIDLPQGLRAVPVTLYLWPTRKTYTREPSAELHLPGSPPILGAALEAVCSVGARLAQPGEFTLRAFLAGRLDLTQAEAVLGVIDAGDRRQLQTALGQLAGGLARPLGRLRERLLDVLAHLEAGLDFVDEDIEFITPRELTGNLAETEIEVERVLAQMASRTETTSVPRVVLYGLPNTGKSSLLNALAGEAAALVSDVAGTTRDYVVRPVEFGGTALLLSDTAGISEIQNRAGLDRAMQCATTNELRRADLSILCLDASRPLTTWETEQLAGPGERRIIVITKCDLPSSIDSSPIQAAIRTSSVLGVGLPELKKAIVETLESRNEEAGVIAGTAERCRDSLRLASEALARARAAIEGNAGDEVVAAEIRLALEELGLVVGAVYTDDILDRVFSRFCIGK